MPQLIFLTVYLGLVAGPQPVELRADGVRAIRLLLDGAPVETLTKPPWKTTVDLGPLQPREIVAIGLDGNGAEVIRSSQLINVPRDTAEAEIVVERGESGAPVRATVSGRHVSYAAPHRVTLHLDNTRLKVDQHDSARLPPIDLKRPHVLAAEVRFEDGSVARRELVIGGEFGETMPTQLTPVCVTATTPEMTIEKPDPFVIIVRDVDPRPIESALAYSTLKHGEIDVEGMKRAASLDPATSVQILLPMPARVIAPEQPTAIVFPISPAIDASRGGLFRIITTVILRVKSAAPTQWADAVAVAGVEAVATGRRRAVILVLGKSPDASHYSPADVRRYLAAIGVPLFVWSVDGPRPDLAGSWGEVVDVSTMEKMDAAGAVVRGALEVQRIAWMRGEPVAALRASSCGAAR